MSTYTTQVRYICETKSGFTLEELENKTVDEIIAASRNNVFNFDFPVYDENFRSVLESTILLHFYTREIGAETVGLWQHYMCRKLREKMPYYNKLFESALLEFNPLWDVDYTRSHEGTAAGQKAGNATRQATENTTDNGTIADMATEHETMSGNTSTETDGSRTENTTSSGTKTGQRAGSKTTHDTHSKSNDHKDYYSDTPMTKVEGVNGMDYGSQTLGANYYLTNYRRIKDEEEGENNGSETQNESTNESTSGTNAVMGTDHSTGSGTTATVRDSNTTDNRTENRTGTRASSANDNTTESFNNTDAYIEHITGKMGSGTFSSMLTEYRDTIINYMEMLLNDLEPLFMNIW